MITVHNLNNSRSVRILWLLEELGLDFVLKQYTRNPSTGLAPDEYKKLHPLGKSPIVTDGDEVLVESGAILETLLERYAEGRLQPEAGSPSWVPYRYWFHAAEGSLMPLLVLKLVLGRMESKSPFFMRPIIKAVTGRVSASYLMPSLNDFLQYMDDTLVQSPWLCGDQFTAADIMMGFPVVISFERTGLGDQFPNVKAYVARIQAREAFKTAMEKNGPFTPMN